MADTWAVPGYGVPAYDQTEMERIRMMQQMQEVLARDARQRVAPQVPMQPDASATASAQPTEPELGFFDRFRAENKRIGLRPDYRRPGEPVASPLTPQQQTMLKPGPVPTDIPGVSPPAAAMPQQAPAGPAATAPQPQAGIREAIQRERNQLQQQMEQSAPGMDFQDAPSGQKLEQHNAANPFTAKAMENVAKEPQGFLDRAQSWLDKVGNVFTVQTKGQDPNAINPAYGVPNAMVWNAQRNALFNAGIVLMAAGMPNTPQGRAQIIAQLGPALSNIGKDIYNTAQSRLMYANATGGSGEWRVEEDETGVYQIDPKTGERKYIEKAGDSNRPMGVEGQIKIWQNPENPDKSLLRKATINAEMIRGYDSAEQLLLAGIYAGRTGQAKEFAVSTLRAFGFADANSENVQALIRTQEYRTKLKDAVLASMQALGGNDSNQELETLTKMVGADTALEPEALLSVVRSGRAKELAAYKNNRSVYDVMLKKASPANRDFIEALAPPEIDTKKYEAGNSGGGDSSELKEGQEKTIKLGGKEYRVKMINGQPHAMIDGKWEPI